MFKNNKVFNIIFKIGKGIFTFFVLAIVGIIFIQKVSDNKVTLFGFSIFTVVSESMAPEYSIGDMIVARKVDEDAIKVNDDVVYLGKVGTFTDKIVTHRVIEIEEGAEKKFHTKGIANNTEDPAISYDQIFGVVIRKSWLLSAVSGIANNSVLFFFILFIPFGIMVFFEILDAFKEKEKLENGE